jgi:hypothetical protein
LIGQIFVATGPQVLTTVLLVDIALLLLVLLLLLSQKVPESVEPPAIPAD